MKKLLSVLAMMFFVFACAQIEEQRVIHSYQKEHLVAIYISAGLIHFTTNDKITSIVSVDSRVRIVHDPNLKFIGAKFPGALSGTVFRNGPFGAELKDVTVYFGTQREVKGFANAILKARGEVEA